MGDKIDYRKRRQLYDSLLNEYGAVCQGCCQEFDADLLQLDHKVPSSLGGGDGLDNLQLLCANCNQIKADELTPVGLRKELIRRGMLPRCWHAKLTTPAYGKKASKPEDLEYDARNARVEGKLPSGRWSLMPKRKWWQWWKKR